MKNKILISIAFVFFLHNILNAQTNQVNLEKYWHYRYRLVNYFLQVGPNDGESWPAGIRNNFETAVQQRALHFGDGGRYWTQYVGTLATEYALLKMNGQDLNETIRELYYALKAIDRLDKNAEIAYGLPSNLNGCISRFDVPVNFVATHSGSGIEGKDLNFQLSNCTIPSVCLQIPGSGQPGYVTGIHEEDYTNVISQDHYSQMLIAYALVKKYVDSGNLSFQEYDANNTLVTITDDLVQMAISQVNRVLLFVKGNNWHYKKGNGADIPNSLGGDWQPFCPGFAKAATYITGVDYSDNFTFTESYWQSSQTSCTRRINNSNLYISLGLAAVSDYWRDGDGNNTTSQGIKYQGDYNSDICVNQPYSNNHYGWDLYFGAINNLLYDKSFDFNDLCRMQQILNTAPLADNDLNPHNGPFMHNSSDLAPNDWAASNRFNSEPPNQTSGEPSGNYVDFAGNYSGLDYMLFHNLYYLLQAGVSGISGYFPNDNPPFSPPIVGETNNPKFFSSNKYIICNNLTVSNFFTYSPPFNTPTEYLGDVQIYGAKQGVNITNTTVENGGSLLVTAINDDFPCTANTSDFLFDANSYNRILPPFFKPQEINLGLQFSVYPNPSSGDFILSTSAQNFTVAIYDLLGNLIGEYKNEKNINLSTQPKGIYFLKLTVNGIAYSQKLIIQ